ncbi:hypothetical protein P3T73_10635 [Kiritimatiellota bacterium B12222]|nr:hypothetical protein P3T73_10635 [Kiritimatiellota bacterium B12222]
MAASFSLLKFEGGTDWTQSVRRVGLLEPRCKALSDEGLREAFHAIRKDDQDRLRGEDLCWAMACVREACLRAVGMRPYDVQVQAGLILASGHIAEMATGEGKTLVAALPAAVLALQGRGVHVATVNAYLAERDHEIMQPIFAFLGLSSALLPERGANDPKREAYAADITYGTGYEFGFDFLRDQLASLSRRPPQAGEQWRSSLLGQSLPQSAPPMQRPLAHAIIDEIDSVLIDEAITPLIISAAVPSGENPAAAVYRQANELALSLEQGKAYICNAVGRPSFTPAGMVEVYDHAPTFPASLMKRAWHEYVLQALCAHKLQSRDVHYLIRNGAVEIIDGNTGRSFSDRKWRSGLHQAVEAKEGVEITHETSSEVTISRQRFYQMYPFLCGMTGTAYEEKAEFKSVYGLDVVLVPRHRPLLRKDHPPKVFKTRADMMDELVREVRDMLKRGRPVLIGTRTLLRSEEISERLQAEQIDHVLLNARQDADEARIISEAGQKGRVTIATNMAGRGADVPLGEGVSDAGGLHVIGVELNESARIDRQLSGRAGRQGDPGSSRFYVTWEDDLVFHPVVLAGRGAQKPIRSKAKYFYRAQALLEKDSFRSRRSVMREDKWLDKIKRNL